MNIVIRAIAGLLIGIAYGFLVYGLVFLLIRPDLVKPSSGLMIIDSAAMAWIGTLFAGIIAGVCGALVGLIVGLVRFRRRTATVLGFATGFVVLGLLSIDSAPHLPRSMHEWIEILVSIAILPIGLGLIGCVVAMVRDRLSRFGLNS